MRGLFFPLAAALAFSAPAAPRAAPPEPFLALELDAASFHAADPERTRARVDAFLAQLGRPLLRYQDNDALLAVTVKATLAEPSGALDGIRRSVRRLRFSRALNGLGLGQVDARGEDWQLILRPPLYESGLRARLASLPEPAELSFYRNKMMIGTIWVRLSVAGLADPKGFARLTAGRYPAEVRSAEIMIDVPVAEFKTGGASP